MRTSPLFDHKVRNVTRTLAPHRPHPHRPHPAGTRTPPAPPRHPTAGAPRSGSTRDRPATDPRPTRDRPSAFGIAQGDATEGHRRCLTEGHRGSLAAHGGGREPAIGALFEELAGGVDGGAEGGEGQPASERDTSDPTPARAATGGAPLVTSTLTGRSSSETSRATSRRSITPGANTTSAPASAKCCRRSTVAARSLAPWRWRSVRAVRTSGQEPPWATSAAAATRSTAKPRS